MEKDVQISISIQIQMLAQKQNARDLSFKSQTGLQSFFKEQGFQFSNSYADKKDFTCTNKYMLGKDGQKEKQLLQDFMSDEQAQQRILKPSNQVRNIMQRLNLILNQMQNFKHKSKKGGNIDAYNLSFKKQINLLQNEIAQFEKIIEKLKDNEGNEDYQDYQQGERENNVYEIFNINQQQQNLDFDLQQQFNRWRSQQQSIEKNRNSITLQEFYSFRQGSHMHQENQNKDQVQNNEIQHAIQSSISPIERKQSFSFQSVDIIKQKYQESQCLLVKKYQSRQQRDKLIIIFLFSFAFSLTLGVFIVSHKLNSMFSR